jgi:hypothetical protein
MISSLLLWEMAKPALRSSAEVSSSDSSSAMAKAKAVGLLGLYAGLERIFENSRLSIFALCYSIGHPSFPSHQSVGEALQKILSPRLSFTLAFLTYKMRDWMKAKKRIHKLKQIHQSQNKQSIR